MYPQPGQTGQWDPNAPPPSSSAHSQQNSSAWAPPQGQPQQSPQGHVPQPNSQTQQNGPPTPNNQYAARPQQQQPPQPQQQHQMPPITQTHQQQGPPMNPMQPQHPEQYRLPPPPGPMYAHSPYHQQPPMQYPAQPAPRQRTAIACRYCRRRKIRCSGFDQNEDGRCTNCQRFQQECVFHPVNQQTQAFVPAHTVLGRQGQMPPQLYGAYGQPLPPYQYYAPQQGPGPNGYPPPPQQYYQQPPPQHMQQPGQPMQHPQMQHQMQQPYYPQPGMIPSNQPQQSPGQQPVQPGPSHPVPTQGSPVSINTQQAGQKRENEEPHTPTVAPPPPGNSANLALPNRNASGSNAQNPSSHGSPPGQTAQPQQASPQNHVNGTRSPATPHNANGHDGYPAPPSDLPARPPIKDEGAGADGASEHAPTSPQGEAAKETGQHQSPSFERLRASTDSDMLRQLGKL